MDKVLLCCIDALRRDHAYEYMPIFKKPGFTKFVNHKASGSHTFANMSYLLTGRIDTNFIDMKFRGGIRNWEKYKLETPTIADYLKQNGWQSFGITGGLYADIGFYEYSGFKSSKVIDPLKISDINEIINCLTKNTFLFLHTLNINNYLDVNHPECDYILKHKIHKYVKLTDQDLQILKKSYLECVLKMNLLLDELFNKLDLDNTLVILTSDHGECFLDDGKALNHGGYAYKADCVYDIPLIINKGNNTVSEKTSDADVVPTILDIIFDKYDSNNFTGKSLKEYL